jgi:1,4-alpha-glucan branching enzyme
MENQEISAECGKWHNKDYHIKVKVPPMGVTFIKGKNITLSTVEIDENNKVLIGGKSKKIKMDKVKTKEL